MNQKYISKDDLEFLQQASECSKICYIPLQVVQTIAKRNLEVIRNSYSECL